MPWQMDACQPFGQSHVQVMSKIHDEEAREFLVQRGEKQRKDHAAERQKYEEAKGKRSFEPSAYSHDAG